MQKATIAVTVPHLFSPLSALSAESKSYIITLRFNIHGTLQINQSNFLIFNNTFIQDL
jgi:hypothetical protein